MIDPRSFLFVFTSIATLTVSVSAAPLDYDEATDGDLADFMGPVFSLSAGTNTVDGVVSVIGVNNPVGQPLGLTFDGDMFEIDVPTGHLLLDARLEVIDIAFGPTNGSASTALPSVAFTLSGFPDPSDFLRIVLRDGIDTSGSAFTFIRAFEGDEFLFNDGLPVGEGVYKVQVNTGSTGATGDGVDSSFGYRWSFEVQAVPEPATSVLGASALGAMAFSHRRKRLLR